MTRLPPTDATTYAVTRRWLGTLGIVAPVAFTASAVVQSLARADHSLVRDPISALAAGPTGWVQDITFVATGLLVIALSFGLHVALRPRRHLDPGPLLLAVQGLGLIGAGAFPATDTTGAFADDRVPHIVAGMVVFSSMWLAALALAPRLARDPAWSDLSRSVRIVGVVLLVLFVIVSTLVRPPGAPLHDWLGLFQWIFLGVWFPCVALLAIRLLRTSRAAQPMKV